MTKEILRRSLAVALLALVSLAVFGTNTAHGDEITINWSDSGWYRDDGFHESIDKNYIAGHNGDGTQIFHNYLVFDLPSVSGTILSATLRLYNPATEGTERTYTLFDVSTPIGTLMADNSGAAGQVIYADLGSGSVLGTNAGPHPDNSIIETSLNAAGLAYIQAALGGLIAFGGDYVGAEGAQNYIFGFSGDGENVRQLVIEFQPGEVVVPAPTGLLLSGMGFVGIGGACWLRRRKQS